VTFQYDWLNRLTNMVDASGTTKYAYTAGGLLWTLHQFVGVIGTCKGSEATRVWRLAASYPVRQEQARNRPKSRDNQRGVTQMSKMCLEHFPKSLPKNGCGKKNCMRNRTRNLYTRRPRETATD